MIYHKPLDYQQRLIKLPLLYLAAMTRPKQLCRIASRKDTFAVTKSVL